MRNAITIFELAIGGIFIAALIAYATQGVSMIMGAAF